MKTKTIKRIIPSQKINMGGHIMDQPLPNQFVDSLDPFLLIHHAKSTLKGKQRPQEVGIPGHPHRGFSPVTFIFKGDVRHQDSFGNDEIVEEGGTQWMHAGKGIVHSERPSAEMAEKGGEQEIIQFWVNTPAKYKMDAPYYLPLSAGETPFIEGESYKINIVAGEYNGVKGPAKTFSPMILMRGSIEAEGSIDLALPENYNTMIYLLDGEMVVNGEQAKRKDFIWFGTEGEQVQLTAQATTRFIVLSGEPIAEKVTSYGPFVMNSQTEIMEAIRDSQMGKMGVLIENFDL